MQKVRVGTAIWFFALNATADIAGSGPGVHFAGQVVHVKEDNRVNIVAWDANGNSFTRQDVPLMQGGDAYAGGDYATLQVEIDQEKADRAMGRGKTSKSADQVKAESTRPETGNAAAPLAAKTGDASTDPLNTAAGNMSDAQRAEGRAGGNPTTGGMTPKIGPDTVLSEREREEQTAREARSAPAAKTKATAPAPARKAPQAARKAPPAAKKAPAKAKRR